MTESEDLDMSIDISREQIINEILGLHPDIPLNEFGFNLLIQFVHKIADLPPPPPIPEAYYSNEFLFYLRNNLSEKIEFIDDFIPSQMIPHVAHTIMFPNYFGRSDDTSFYTQMVLENIHKAYVEDDDCFQQIVNSFAQDPVPAPRKRMRSDDIESNPQKRLNLVINFILDIDHSQCVL